MSLWTAFPPTRLRRNTDGDVEALDHYANRVSANLSATRETFIETLTRSSNSTSVGYIGWVGPSGKSFFARLRGLSELTGQRDLHQGTLCSASAVLSKDVNGGGFTGLFRRWCPKCYLEWDDEASFEPVHWHFLAFARCDRHGCLFESCCATCGARQQNNVSQLLRRVCARCNADLANNGTFAKPSKMEEWTDGRLLAFARYLSGLDEAIHPTGLATLNAIILPKWRYVNSSQVPSQVINWLSRAVRKSGEAPLGVYLSFAGYFSCEIADLFERPEEVATASLFAACPEYSRLVVGHSVPSFRVLRLALSAKRLLLGSDIRLPSLNAVGRCFSARAQSLKYSYSSLYFAYHLRSRASPRSDAFNRAFLSCFRSLERSAQDEAGLRERIITEVSRINRTKGQATSEAFDAAYAAFGVHREEETYRSAQEIRAELERWARSRLD